MRGLDSKSGSADGWDADHEHQPSVERGRGESEREERGKKEGRAIKAVVAKSTHRCLAVMALSSSPSPGPLHARTQESSLAPCTRCYSSRAKEAITASLKAAEGALLDRHSLQARYPPHTERIRLESPFLQ